MSLYSSSSLFGAGVDPAQVTGNRSTQRLVKDDVVVKAPTDRDAALVDAIRRLESMEAKTEDTEPVGA